MKLLGHFYTIEGDPRSTSGKFTEAASIRTRACPGSIAGGSISSTRTTSGGPSLGQIAARKA